MTRKTKNRVLLGFLSIFVVGFIALLYGTIVTEQRRLESMASVAIPPELAYHARLAEAIENTREDAPPPPELLPTLKIIAQWSELFGRAAKEIDSDELTSVWNVRSSEGGWEALSVEDVDSILAFLEKHGEFKAALREITALGGPTRIVSLSQSEDDPLPWMTAVRDAARLLCLDAIAHARAGRIEEAVSSYIAGMQVAEALAPEPTLVSQNVRYHVVSILFSAIQDAFPPGTLSPELTSRLLQQVRYSAGRENLLPGIQEENLQTLRALDPTLNHGWLARNRAVNQYTHTDQDFLIGTMTFAYASPLARPWYNRDLTSMAALLNHRLEIARHPYYEALPLVEADFDAMWEDGTILPLTMMFPFFVGDRALVAQAEHEARLQLLQTGLTLEQRYAENGSYPSSLEALSSALPENTTIDPFTGVNFVYESQGDSFRLYSLGRNQTDDDGKGNKWDGDIVWRQHRTHLLWRETPDSYLGEVVR